MKNHREMLKSKVLCCYDIEGIPNWKYIEFLHELNKWFLNHGSHFDYIGLAPYGSQVKGYALPTSDYDIVLFAGNGNVHIEDALQKHINDIAKKFGRKGNSPHIRGRDFFEGNFGIESDEHPGTSYSDPLAFLLYPCIGRTEELEKYREMARKKHRYHLEHHVYNARLNARDVVDEILIFELNVRSRYGENVRRQLIEGRTSKKMLARGFTIQEIEALVRARKMLWAKRLDKMLTSDLQEEVLC